MKKRLWALLLALTIAIFPTFAFADSDKGVSGKAAPAQSIENEGDYEEELEQIKEWITLKNAIEAEKDGIEELKNEVELEKEALEEQYEAARESGDQDLAASIRAQIEEIRGQIDGYKLEMKVKIEDMHEVMKQQYTAEEWSNLQAIAEELSADPTLTVLPVENIFFSGGQMKFDTPPVIKEGRTLIPIRSISTALGADVTWDNIERTAIIVYGDNTIEFSIEDKTVYVNDEVAQIDVPARIMNGRIVVPLRFVIESMELDVEWENETQTIMISE